MSEELPEECCAKCRFWWSNSKDSYGERDGIYGDSFYAPCRRFPRVFVGGHNLFCYDNWDQPVMMDDDWCGEFQPRKVVEPPRNPVLDWPIRDMDVSVRCRHALKRAPGFDGRIVFVRDIVRMTVDELCEIKNFGAGSLREIREWLAKHNLSLNGDTP